MLESVDGGRRDHRSTTVEPKRSGVSVDDALRSAGALLRRQPNALLPYYALRAAAADVARLPLLVGVVVAYLALRTSGRLGPVVDELGALNPELLAPDSPTGLPAATSQRLVELVTTPTVVGPLLVAVALAVVSYVVARAVTRAASLSAVAAGLRDDAPLAAGIDGIERWRTFAGLVVVRWGLLLVAGVPVLAAVLGGATTLGATPAAADGAVDQQTVLAVLSALAGVTVTVAAALVVLALLAFAGPAAVVEGVGVRTAVRRSAGVPFAHPAGFVFYVVVLVASYLVLGVCAAILGVAGVGRLAALGSTFLLAPVLDSLAVGLYLGWVDEDTDGDGDRPEDESGSEEWPGPTRDDAESVTFEANHDGDSTPSTAADEPTTGGTESVSRHDPTAGGAESAGGHDSTGERATAISRGSTTRSRLRAVFGAGLRELVGFVRADWGYVVVAAAVLAAGVVGGWGATAGYGVRIPTPTDPAQVFGSLPVGPFVTIAVNNWLVATSASFSGLFAGLPTVGTLLFNGLLIGAVAGVVDPLVFVALVGPHGIVELPAIAVAGGVGLRLGHVAWGTWRGRLPRTALVDEVGRSWRIVVGLAVVFVVAGFVEAFVTPQVAAAVLG